MVKTFDKNAQRMKRHTRVRGKISGTSERPRLNVYRSNANIYAQIIDDVNGVTLASASTLDKDFEGATGNKEAARKVGKLVAERAKAKGIDTVVFDRLAVADNNQSGELHDTAALDGLGNTAKVPVSSPAALSVPSWKRSVFPTFVQSACARTTRRTLSRQRCRGS